MRRGNQIESQAHILPAAFVVRNKERKSDGERVRLEYYQLGLFLGVRRGNQIDIVSHVYILQPVFVLSSEERKSDRQEVRHI